MALDTDFSQRRKSSGNVSSAPYPPSAVANYFLSRGGDLTQMQLHKLLYYAHGWYLAVVGKPLLNETVSAWKHGPVVPSLYYDFKRFGARPVDRLAKTIDRVSRVRRAPQIDASDFMVRSLLERIWMVYGQLSGKRLSQLTHAADTPWSAVRGRNPELHGVDIPNEEIRAYFERRLALRSESV
jgi:uncharacterized phage-associated protein